MSLSARRLKLGESDSYLASLSDLLVGMLFVFIIMLMAFALNYRTAQEEQEEERTTLEQQNAVLTRAQAVLRENDRIRRMMLRRVRDALEAQGVQGVIVDFDKGILRLPETLRLFDSGKATLREDGQIVIEELAIVLDRILPCYAVNDGRVPVTCPEEARSILEAIYVEGHTDDVPITGELAAIYPSNWSLSTARAVETYKVIVGHRPNLGELRNESEIALLGVSGYSDQRPVASNVTADGRSQNRRIDLRFLLAAPTAEQIEEIRSQVQEKLLPTGEND